jgi:hypothetical protein
MINGHSMNYCRPEQISTCTAGSPKEQASCRFYEKSCRVERCMYFIFDEYCDCLLAQLNAAPTAQAQYGS